MEPFINQIGSKCFLLVPRETLLQFTCAIYSDHSHVVGDMVFLEDNPRNDTLEDAQRFRIAWFYATGNWPRQEISEVYKKPLQELII